MAHRRPSPSLSIPLTLPIHVAGSACSKPPNVPCLPKRGWLLRRCRHLAHLGQVGAQEQAPQRVLHAARHLHYILQHVLRRRLLGADEHRRHRHQQVHAREDVAGVLHQLVQLRHAAAQTRMLAFVIPVKRRPRPQRGQRLRSYQTGSRPRTCLVPLATEAASGLTVVVTTHRV